MSHARYFLGSVFWGTAAKVIDAVVKFATIPMLIHHFGKDDYGLLTLAMAANAYMQLLDLGINTGAIKFFSQWIAEGRLDLVRKVARSSLAFYGWIGIANGLLLVCLAVFSDRIFHVQPSQTPVLREMLLVLAGFSIFNWFSSVANQLLMANHEMVWIQQVTLLKSLATFALAGATLWMKLGLDSYFWWLSGINTLATLPLLLSAKKRGLLQQFWPNWDWEAFQPVFKYSMGIFAMSLFQFTASQSRPLVLGIFSPNGTAVLTDYRVMEVFPLFLLSIGGMLLTTLLPSSSTAIHENNQELISSIAYRGTRIVTIFLCALCFPIIIVSDNLLTIYVGTEYSRLGIWLAIWCISIILSLHTTPVSSLILASGKTKQLVFTSAFSCIVSIAINAALCKKYGAGSAVIGFSIYVITQISFSYMIFIPSILKLDAFRIFKNFLTPFIHATLCAIPAVVYFSIFTKAYTQATQILTSLFSWILLFGLLTYSTNKSIAVDAIQKIMNFKQRRK